MVKLIFDKRGFLLIESLILFSICIILVSIMYACSHVIKFHKKEGLDFHNEQIQEIYESWIYND